MEPTEGVRLQKVLAQAGVASRRGAEQLIRAGRVTVNGRPAILGQRIDPATDAVELDGTRLPLDRGKVYYALHKPPGVITTARDPQGRRTVIELAGLAERVFPVGRLDAATEGLLLLTNDGELAHRLTHPSFGAPRTYVAEVAGAVGRDTVRRLLRDGADIGEGRPVRPSDVRVLSAMQGPRPRSVVEVQIHEGRKHVVRRMLEAAGHPVERLVRTAVGPIRLGRLAPGTYRRLSDAEVSSLYRAVGL